MEDKTETLRNDKDIKEALQAISQELIKGEFNPVLLYYPTIIEALKELIQIRAKTKK